jgi:NAD(P)-dependent dehydrogenase (short-subunit alcohol dehydrogenase family)
MSEFSDKVVLVTGAGKSLGRAISAAFAAQGARLAVNDVTPVNLDETVRRIRADGGQVKDYVFDVAKKMPVQAMISQVLDDSGRIDVLVNNAGVQPHMPLLDMDEWDWQRTLDVNLSGPFFAIQTVGRVMRQQGGGVIVNIAAEADCARTLKYCSAYAASKAGLVGLTRAAALELAAYHIRLNAVCPQEAEAGAVAPDAVRLVLFLCSAAASDLTGKVINVGENEPVG